MMDKYTKNFNDTEDENIVVLAIKSILGSLKYEWDAFTSILLINQTERRLKRRLKGRRLHDKD